MPKVKICGLRRPEDITYVNKYLPEYAGFIFAESKRRVMPELAAALAANLDGRIRKAGVFVNETAEKVVEVAGGCGLDVIQLHGDEPPGYVEELKRRLLDGKKEIKLWKAFRVKDAESLSKMKDYGVDAFVLDAYAEGSYGGSGKVFDWNLAMKAGKYGKIVLAGGLDAGNAWKAIGTLQPFALDVSSGVETGGCKDERKIREFINTVRSYG